MTNKREIKIHKTKEDTSTISINKLFLHSKYYPTKEAQKFLDNNEKIYKNKKTVVLYGIGLGYHLKELLNRIDKDCVVYAFDIDKEIVIKAKELGMLKEIEQDNRIKIFDGYSQQFLQDFSHKIGLVEDILVYKPSVKVLPDEYEKFKDTLKGFELAKLSVERFGDIASENYKVNQKVDSKSLKEFYKQCNIKNKPVIIVAAGPSLENDIETLKKYQGKIKIFGVGRVLNTLMRNGIKPDMITIIDSQELVYNQLKGYEDCGIPLCFLSTSSRWAVEKYKGPKYMFYNSENIDDIMINTGKTVAVATLDIAVKGGADKIIFVGQDLAYIGDKHHAGENSKISDRDLKNNNFKKVIGVNEDSLNTTSGLLNFKRNIENIIIDNPKIEFINCSKGARIKGTKEMDLESYLEYLG